MLYLNLNENHCFITINIIEKEKCKTKRLSKHIPILTILSSPVHLPQHLYDHHYCDKSRSP